MDALDHQVEYWDRVAGEKTFTVPLDVERFRELVPLDAQVLDYGCGYGRICGELAVHGYRRIVGVDHAPAMIERARCEHPELEFGVSGFEVGR